MAKNKSKKIVLRNNYSLRKFLVNVVSRVLNRNDAASLQVGNNGDGLAAVTAEREEKGVKLLVVSKDFLDNIFFSLNSSS